MDLYLDTDMKDRSMSSEDVEMTEEIETHGQNHLKLISSTSWFIHANKMSTSAVFYVMLPYLPVIKVI